MTGAGQWRIAFEIARESDLAAFEVALADLAVAVGTERDERNDSWRVICHSNERPDQAAVERSVAAAAAAADIDVPAVVIHQAQSQDWVGEQERALAPLSIGRFHVFGSHVQGSPPPTAIPIQIDAGLAFGTGRHQSTAGCLTAIDRLYVDGLRPLHPMDVGTGSGILGIAVARCFDVPTIATDIDPTAVRVANENAFVNGVSHLFNAVVADGIAGVPAGRDVPCDLIIANIFAQPLIRLASTAAFALETGGHAILAGFRHTEMDAVANAYRTAGIECTDHIDLAGWTTLVGTRRQ